MEKESFTKVILQNFTSVELLSFIRDIPDKYITFNYTSNFHSQFSWGEEKCSPQIRKNLTDYQGQVGYIQNSAVITYSKCTIETPI